MRRPTGSRGIRLLQKDEMDLMIREKVNLGIIREAMLDGKSFVSPITSGLLKLMEAE